MGYSILDNLSFLEAVPKQIVPKQIFRKSQKVQNIIYLFVNKNFARLRRDNTVSSAIAELDFLIQIASDNLPKLVKHAMLTYNLVHR